MSSGSFVNKWMLEFAICDVKDDRLIAKMLSVAPMLKDDMGLKKIILLREIESELAEYSVSEKMLDALENVFELDRIGGVDVLESMKIAYCSVAVDCVVRFVRGLTGEDEYFDAVKRIFRKRIRWLRAGNVDLISDDLENWMDTIDSAVWNNDLREKLFERNTRYEALKAVRRYLVDAWKTVGPRFSSSLLKKSAVEAQVLCLQKIGETNKGNNAKFSNIPQGSGDNSNPNINDGGEFLYGQQNPSSHVSSLLLKNKDREHFSNTVTQNPAGNMHEDESNASLNLNRDEIARLECIGTSKDKNILQTLPGISQSQVENLEPVYDKCKSVEEAALPLPGMCDNNSYDHDDLSKGGGTDVVNEHTADLPPAAPQINLQHLKNLKAQRKVGVRRKYVGGPRRLSKRVRINDSEGMDIEGSNKQHDPLPEIEAIKLKYSSIALHDVVKDPLLEALNVAEAVLSNLSRNFVPQGNVAASAPDKEALKSCDVEVEKGNDEASTSHINIVRTISMNENSMNSKTNQAHETCPSGVPNNQSSPIDNGHSNDKLQNESSGHVNLQERANLWERNASTRTNELDDSVDGSPEGNFRLPTPKNTVSSPLKKYVSQKFPRRRKKWSAREEDTLRDAIQRYGKGNWKMILNANRDVFEGRTEVDLKDKWRNMTRYCL